MGTFHKVLLCLAIGSFADIIGLAVVGNVLQSRGVQNTSAILATFKLTTFSLYIHYIDVVRRNDSAYRTLVFDSDTSL